MTLPNQDRIRIKVLQVTQPIGQFYFGVINHSDLLKISYSDIRKLDNERRDVENYLGIERPLNRKRVGELKDYVNTVDATFPSPIILALQEEDTDQDPENGTLLVRNDENVDQDS